MKADDPFSGRDSETRIRETVGSEEMLQVLKGQSEATPWWTESELRPILRHLLSTSLIEEVEHVRADWLRKLRGNDRDSIEQSSLGALLESPETSAEVLVAIKNLAKFYLNDPERSLPGDVALALYFFSILTLRKRGYSRATSLPEEELRKGARWLLKQAWLEKNWRELAEAFLTSSEGGSPQSPER